MNNDRVLELGFEVGLPVMRKADELEATIQDILADEVQLVLPDGKAVRVLVRGWEVEVAQAETRSSATDGLVEAFPQELRRVCPGWGQGDGHDKADAPVC